MMWNWCLILKSLVKCLLNLFLMFLWVCWLFRNFIVWLKLFIVIFLYSMIVERFCFLWWLISLSIIWRDRRIWRFVVSCLVIFWRCCIGRMWGWFRDMFRLLWRNFFGLWIELLFLWDEILNLLEILWFVW